MSLTLIRLTAIVAACNFATILVDGYEFQPQYSGLERQMPIVLPYEGFRITKPQDLELSYIIENRRYVEAIPSRCHSTTILANPESVEPTFVIITKTSETRLNATAPSGLVRMSGFDPRKPTTVIVHGYTQSYPNTAWLRKTRALFEIHSLVGRQNLIIMDWSRGSHGSYAQVAAMVSGMGSFLANFLLKLVIELGTDRMNIHVVGHSLGAHLVGFAGKRIRPRIGRITALDPAGPCFGKFFSNSQLDRLSPDDAFQVAVYHYDDDFLGLQGQHGHFDVYVNGGSSQPGCQSNMNTMLNIVTTVILKRNRFLSESHSRSTEVSSSKLSNTECQQVAYECRDYAAFRQGECGKCDQTNNQCFLMSLHYQHGDGSLRIPPRSSFPGKRLYILTGSREPFCLHHHQVQVKFELNPKSKQQDWRNKWQLQLQLFTEMNELINVTMNNQVGPDTFTHLLLGDSPRPIRIHAAGLQVRSSDGGLIPLQIGEQLENSALRVVSLEVNYMSNINPQIRRALSSRLCPKFYPLAGGQWSMEGIKSAREQLPSTWIRLNEC